MMYHKLISENLISGGGLPPHPTKLLTLLVVAFLSGCMNPLQPGLENIEVKHEDYPVPDTPDSFSAYPSDGMVTLTWKVSDWEEFESYELYQGDECIAIINNVDTNSYTDTGLENGTEYGYRIRVRDLNDKVSPFSALIRATPQLIVSLTIPQSFSGTAGNGQVTLSWAQNGDKYFTQYELYRDEELLALITEQDQVSYIDQNLNNKQSYRYKMRVSADSGEVSEFSSVIEIIPEDTEAPAIPANLQASAGDGQTTISWKANTEGDFASYQIYCKSSGDWELVTTITDIATISFQDIGLNNGQEYTYAVTAKDIWNNENSIKEVVSITVTPQDITSPNMPVDFAAEVDDLAVSLSWNASAAADFSCYELFRDDQLIATIDNKNIVTFEDTGLSYETIYSYDLFVYDQAGNVSEPARVMITTAVDEVPPALGDFSVNAFETAATLSWSSSSIQDFSSYNIYRDDSLLETITDQLITNYTDLNLNTNQVYEYQMNISDQAGNLSTATPMVAVTPRDITPPPAPGNLNGEGSKGYIELYWDPISVADFERYEIYRDDMLVEEVYDMNMNYLADTLADQIGQEYSYRMQAVDTSGNVSDLTQIITVKVRDPYGYQEINVISDQITVAWDYDGDLPEGFRLYYRSHGTTDSWTMLGETTDTEYTVTWEGPHFNGVWDYGVAGFNGDEERKMHTSLDENADPNSGWYLNWNYNP